MNTIKVGAVLELNGEVTKDNTALAVGSGDLEVFATPMMICLMENAAANCLKPYLQEGQTSVGTSVTVQHSAATPLGMKVKARAEITQVDRRKVSFKIEAFDERVCIGTGVHERFIVDSEKFIAKVNS